MRKCLVIAALFAVASVAAAQCWGQSRVPGPAPVVQRDRILVQRIGPDEVAIYVDGVQIGNVDATKKAFRRYDAASDTWGGCGCTDCQCRNVGAGDDWKERGVDKSKLRDVPAVTGNVGSIPDDTGKLRVSVIGSKEQRKPVIDAVQSEFGDSVVVWACDPDHWSLTDTETGNRVFKTHGSPTVYVQSPDGKVLHRQDDARDAVGAIRKASKPYAAELDPDLRKTALPVLPGGGNLLPMLALAGVAVFLFFRNRLGV